MRRFIRLMMAAALAGIGLQAQAQEGDPLHGAVLQLMFGGHDAYEDARTEIAAYGKPDIVPSLIIAQRFGRQPEARLDTLMQELTGAEAQGWHDWMLWQEANDQIVPAKGYVAFKRALLLNIDPRWSAFLSNHHMDRTRMKIRPEEITWGGVRLDGIPSLDHPELVAADAPEAGYLIDDDLVFGVSINGDARAYPLRVMGWHEMFNDVIGGVPLALAYCTLCGSGILFETAVEGRDAPFEFGSSGFLYRSNKLMFDRETMSLWNQFTGQPVSGPLVDSGIALKQRPVVIERWADWRAANPGTKVITLNTGVHRDYGSGVVYRDYFASPDLMFPTLVDETLARQKDHVFAIRAFGAARAWPLSAFEGGRVITDRMGDQPLILIGDSKGRTVRAYASDGRDVAGLDGWSVAEDTLTAPDGAAFPRVAGHVAYWFAFKGYLGELAELWIE